MSRVRVSTTVDGDLLTEVRRAHPGVADSALLDRSLAALLHLRRADEIDGTYAAYDEQPITEPDEWGDLGAFRAAAGRS